MAIPATSNVFERQSDFAKRLFMKMIYL